MPIIVSSDRLAQRKKKDQEMMEYLTGEPEYVPVDMHGARTDFPKDNANPTGNLAKAGEDIKKRFDFDLPHRTEDVKGGE